MEHESGAGSGVSRRDLLRRGAVVGGALAWSVPVVQTVGMRAAGAQGTPAGRSFTIVLESGATEDCTTPDGGATWTC